MRIGYIASHLFLHTFEINEAAELVRQRPDTRLYSFYRPRGRRLQRRHAETIRGEVVTWTPASVVAGAVYLMIRRPAACVRGAVLLAVASAPNPVYWVKNTLAFFIALPILADAHRQGVTHLHANFGSSPATIAWLGRVILGTGLSVTYHAFDIYSRAFASRDPLKARKLRDADLVVAVHAHGLRTLRETVPAEDADKFRMIHIGVVFDAVDKPAATPEPPLVLAVGNLVPKKGFDVLVRAVGRLRRRGVAVRLRILGEGSERRSLEALAAAEGLAGAFELPGFVPHGALAEHLAEAAVFAAPSRVTAEGQRDGIPTVVVEAWLARTPVVASTVGGMDEVIVDGRTGLVFAPEDVDALSRALERLLGAPELRRRLADAGYDVAVRAFSARRNVERLLDEIEDRTQGRRAA